MANLGVIGIEGVARSVHQHGLDKFEMFSIGERWPHSD
jgi:hypothetical protein